MKDIPIGLVGYGTVGQGVAAVLAMNGEQISRKIGGKIYLKHVVEKFMDRPFDVPLPAGVMTNNLDNFLSDPSVEIAIELIGGTTIAKEVVEKLLRAGKHVVTANKALLAHHGKELFALARKHNRCIAFEASCGGGIPLVESIRRGLVANEINAIYGIVNGTCNYILSAMSREGKEYATALKEAQAAGFAEADPALDVNGTDTAHKLTILAGLAFARNIPFESISIEGIDKICIEDIRYGHELGYIIKLLAICIKEQDGISVRVHPAFISKNDPLAPVFGPFNAISVYGNAVGHAMFYGRGAGRMPTASAVVSDVIDIVLGNALSTFKQLNVLPDVTPPAVIKPIEEISSRYYLRLMVVDRPGVLAKLTEIFGRYTISISAVLQHEGAKYNKNGESIVPVVVLTHRAREGNLQSAIKEIGGLDVSAEKPVCIRVVDEHPEWQ
ncbi:MAG: homoserine dehydrogenase [Phycisphaerae bacterium]